MSGECGRVGFLGRDDACLMQNLLLKDCVQVLGIYGIVGTFCCFGCGGVDRAGRCEKVN